MAVRSVRFALLLACFCASAALLGCGGGSSTAEVTGKITINNQAPGVKGIQVSFHGEKGQIITAPLKEDGSFVAEEVPVGEVKVGFVFVQPGLTPVKGRRSLKKADEETTVKSVPNPIPEQLRDFTTSNITVKVEAGKSNVFNYDIKP